MPPRELGARVVGDLDDTARGQDAIARFERTVTGFWSSGGEVTELPGGTVVHHATAPDQPLGNFACALRSETAAVLERLLDGPAPTPPCDRVVLDAATPAGAEAHLALHDWRIEVQLLLVLPAETSVALPEHLPDLHDVHRATDWAAIEALFRIDHLEEDARAGTPPRPAEATRSAVELRRSLGPAVRYHLAGDVDQPRGCIATWVGPEGVGVIEDVFVHPQYRGMGLATDLLRHAVHGLREEGVSEVLIGAEVTDTPKHLYHRFGFRPAAVLLSYER
jgi:GNAT superfamily N-acetyltransferase